MKILLATTQVPFIRGGAEIHAEGLIKALRAEGHEAEIVAIPFKSYPPERILDNMLSCRLLDLSEFNGQPIDRVIGMKFPAYLIPHPHKIIWLLHQHREAYELWDDAYGDLITSPNGLQMRDAIINADRKAFGECRSIFANSANVSNRLKKFNQIDSTPLYHPPQNAELFYYEESEDYLFFPSRLTNIKRQHTVIEALRETKNPVRVVFAGKADAPTYIDHLKNLAMKLKVLDRITFLGGISEEDKLKNYARAIGVVYPPFDEDYGYVTLEAMLASKPLITCTDSGGPLEFVLHQKTGLIVESSSKALAAAMDQLWEDRTWAKTMGKSGRERYDSLEITWSAVVKRLLS